MCVRYDKLKCLHLCVCVIISNDMLGAAHPCGLRLERMGLQWRPHYSAAWRSGSATLSNVAVKCWWRGSSRSSVPGPNSAGQSCFFSLALSAALALIKHTVKVFKASTSACECMIFATGLRGKLRSVFQYYSPQMQKQHAELVTRVAWM